MAFESFSLYSEKNPPTFTPMNRFDRPVDAPTTYEQVRRRMEAHKARILGVPAVAEAVQAAEVPAIVDTPAL